MRVLITGSRNFCNYDLLSETLDKYNITTIVHGGCRGADTLAHQYAREHNIDTEVHKAQWDYYGKAAGCMRNEEMVAKGADICVAFPLPGSRGTYDCMAKARRASIEVVEAKE